MVMEGEIGHNCGFCLTHTLSNVYDFITLLQHRGRDATGIAAIGDNRIDVLKWLGPVSRFDRVNLHQIFPSSQYHTYFAHVRYPTRGNGDNLLQYAHPQVIGGNIKNFSSHVIIRDCEMVMVHNGTINEKYLTSVPKKDLKTTCDTEALLHLYKRLGARGLMEAVPGSYTLALADRGLKDVVVMRDRFAMKPGVLGLMDGKYCAASEDNAIRENHGSIVEDLNPGSIYYFSPFGAVKKEKIITPNSIKHCFFCWNYIADSDSNLDKLSVTTLRRTLGEKLAEEFHPSDADFVTYIPRCPKIAAQSYSERTGIPFIELFYKMRGERSFQGSNALERKESIQRNLFLLDNMTDQISGKNVIVVDDSTIRGNASKLALDLLKSAGVGKMWLANYTPMIGITGEDGVPRGCEFGVDMPPNDNFVARGRTLEEISKVIGTETFFLSVQGSEKAYASVGMPAKDLCTYCIGGKHPFAD